MSESILIATQKIPTAALSSSLPRLTLALTAEERTRSRHHFELANGQSLLLRLPRGTVLKHLDYLETENNVVIEIQAKPEPVLTVTASDRLTLLRAAYHLGNRHVPIEITPDYLRFSPDPVLQKMLHHLGLEIQAEIVPFFPEAGAYVHAH